MKKIILITGILLSTSLWADMDYECSVMADSKIGDMPWRVLEYIKDNCERNNIFKVHGLDEEGLYKAIPKWCRMDREINFWKSEREEREEYYYLVCVLYDNEWRKDVVLD